MSAISELIRRHSIRLSDRTDALVYRLQPAFDWRSNSKSETNTGGVVRFRPSPDHAVVVPNICRDSASDMESFHKRSSVTNYLIEAGKDFILGRLSRFLDMKVDVEVGSPDLFVHKSRFNGNIITPTWSTLGDTFFVVNFSLCVAEDTQTLSKPTVTRIVHAPRSGAGARSPRTIVRARVRMY